jgi:Tfp pilus assembly protein FimT
MPFTLSSSTLPDTLENTDFSGVVTVVPDDPAVDIVTSITVARGSQFTLGPNIATDISANTVTISGQYSGNFSAGGITFLDKDSKSQTVLKFTDVPSDFSTVISYSPSGTSNGDATYTVSVNGNVAGTVTQTVINNYSTGRDALIALVAKGKF